MGQRGFPAPVLVLQTGDRNVHPPLKALARRALRHKVAGMKIASLGAGRMASALLGALVRGGVCSGGDLCVASRTPASRGRLAESLGARAAGSLSEAVAGADVVLVCVKPAGVRLVLEELASDLRGKLVISIAAGIGLESLEEWAPGARHARAMPNTPVEIGLGATAIVLGSTAQGDDAETVRRIFESAGEVFEIGESMMDAVTALSGSGPAYFFLFFEALADAGVALGLPRDIAQRLALQTGRGAAELAVQSGRDPALLREQVTSPGGTTAAALEVMESAALRDTIVKALQAAANRSRELSNAGARPAC